MRGGEEMVISKRKQLIMFFIWIIIVPPGLFIAYNYFPSRELDWLNISILFVILFLTMLITITITKRYNLIRALDYIRCLLPLRCYLRRWYSFNWRCLFYYLAEKVLYRISIRFLVNSSMFAVVSIVSGSIFHFAGGTIGIVRFFEYFHIRITICN